MKSLPVKIALVVWIVTLLSFLSCFNAHAGSTGVCSLISPISYPVLALIKFTVDALARWNLMDLQDANFFVLMGVGSLVWSLFLGFLLAPLWKKFRS